MIQNNIQTLFQDLRRKAARLVAAKCTLASRVDSFHESVDGKVIISLMMIITAKTVSLYKDDCIEVALD